MYMGEGEQLDGGDLLRQHRQVKVMLKQNYS